MKKIFTLLVSLCALSSVFAQYGGNSYPQQRDDRNNPQQRNDRTVVYQNEAHQQPDYARNTNNAIYGRNDQQDNRGYGDRQRQPEMDRTNHDYDNRNGGYRNGGYENRNGGYRNDRTINDYGRNRGMQQGERERNGKLKSIGTGVLLGGIIGVLIGTHL